MHWLLPNNVKTKQNILFYFLQYYLFRPWTTSYYLGIYLIVEEIVHVLHIV